LQHPAIYRIMVSLFARLNPEWSSPEKVGAQLYECKEKFPSNQSNSFSHVDAHPFNLFKELENGKIVPEIIQAWIPLQTTSSDTIKVEFGAGCHLTWKSDCCSIEKDEWPSGITKACNVLKYIPTLKPRMVDVTSEVKPGDLVVWHSLVPHQFTQFKEGCRRDTYVNYAWFNGDEFCGNNSMSNTLSCYIGNRAPLRYAHILTGNLIPSKWQQLEPLIQHSPPPLHILGEAIFGIETRSWNDTCIENILKILFQGSLQQRTELEHLLNESVANIMERNVKVQMELVQDANYIQQRKKLAEIIEMDLGFKSFVSK